MTTPAASVIVVVGGMPEIADTTWPNARTCAAAHRSEVGTVMNTVSRSTAGE